jgi:Uma2 family endonuclease
MWSLTKPAVLPETEVDPLPVEVPWTPRAYHAAYEAGAFGDKRVELIEGKVYEKMTMSDPHKIAVGLVADALGELAVKGERYLNVQVPERLGDSEPESDATLLRGDRRRPSNDPADVLLVVEVSDATLVLDRREKLRRYARAGYQEYWLLNLRNRTLEVRRQPRQENNEWRYADLRTLASGQRVEPLAVPGRAVAVDDLLP